MFIRWFWQWFKVRFHLPFKYVVKLGTKTWWTFDVHLTCIWPLENTAQWQSPSTYHHPNSTLWCFTNSQSINNETIFNFFSHWNFYPTEFTFRRYFLDTFRWLSGQKDQKSRLTDQKQQRESDVGQKRLLRYQLLESGSKNK